MLARDLTVQAFPAIINNEENMTYQIKITNTQGRLNIRKTLDDFVYTDKRTDLAHKLTNDERDSIARFFYGCQDDQDWDERDIIKIAERQVKKRLGIK